MSRRQQKNIYFFTCITFGYFSFPNAVYKFDSVNTQNQDWSGFPLASVLKKYCYKEFLSNMLQLTGFCQLM